MGKMFRLYIFLFFCGFVVKINGGTTVEETLSRDVQSNPQAPEEANKVMPSMKIVEQSIASAQPESSSTTQHAFPHPSNYEIRQYNWPFFPFYNPYPQYNPYLNIVNAAFFKKFVDEYTVDLEMIKHRQNQLLKYAEYSCPGSEKCPKVDRPDGTEDIIRSVNNWNSGYGTPDVDYVTYERFYTVMDGFKSAIIKLTLRQNMVYEFVECSCTAKNECGTSIKPVLDVMFANNRNETGQLIQNLFVPGSYNAASSFFQMLASYLSQIPSWFNFNFSPLAYHLAGGYQPFYTSPTNSTIPSASSSSSTGGMPASSPYTTTYPTTAQTMPSVGYSGVSSSGGQPVHSSSSSFSSSAGSGQQVSGGHVSTGIDGKPSQESYHVSLNGENVHISSSADGKGVSVSSTKPPGARRLRYTELDPFLRLDPVQASVLAAQDVQAGLIAVQQEVQSGVILVQQGVQAGIASVQQGLNAGLAASLQG